MDAVELDAASGGTAAAGKPPGDCPQDVPEQPVIRTAACLQCTARCADRRFRAWRGAHDEPKPEPWWDGSYMLLPLRSDAGGDDAGTLRGPDRVLSALLFARVASSFARIAVTTLCAREPHMLGLLYAADDQHSSRDFASCCASQTNGGV